MVVWSGTRFLPPQDGEVIRAGLPSRKSLSHDVLWVRLDRQAAVLAGNSRAVSLGNSMKQVTPPETRAPRRLPFSWPLISFLMSRVLSPSEEDCRAAGPPVSAHSIITTRFSSRQRIASRAFAE